jgi:hypothetical protein
MKPRSVRPEGPSKPSLRALRLYASRDWHWQCQVAPGLTVRNSLRRGEARVACSTQRSQRDAEIAEKTLYALRAALDGHAASGPAPVSLKRARPTNSGELNV